MVDQVKQIGGYTYKQRFCLGEGSFGKVYEGSSKNGKAVAIKKVDKRMIYSDQYLKKSVESEIEILKKFNHPNIVKLEEVVLTANSIYIVTQFCRNGDLKAYIRRKKPDQDECVRILLQLVSGMKEVVKQGIIHRDLKPANVLVHEGTFKICDFGFANYLTQVGKMNRTCVGTPMYMSPQALKHKPYTNKTDVWSLGVVFYEILFGRTPWQGNAEDELYRNITTRPLTIPFCSKFSNTLLRGMLEIEESTRWSWQRIFEFVEQPHNLAENAEKPSLFYQEQNNAIQFNQLKLQKQQSEQRKVETSRPSQATQSQDLKINDENSSSRLRNPIFQQKGEVKIKPKNMLAYFEVDRSEEDPRFCYFILVQLFTTPIKSPNFQAFLSKLYEHTLQLYASKIQKEKPPFRDLLQFELTQIRSMGIRQFNVRLDVRELGQLVLNDADKQPSQQKQWIRRLLERRYVYDPI